MEKADVVIIGAGGAGLMCAIESAKRGQRTIVLDHAAKIGAKILISGGGRCNFTNTDVTPSQYVSQNPDFCRSALSRYTASDFIALVEKHKIKYHEKKLGQLFCDDSAKQILKMLIQECSETGALIHPETKIISVSKTREGFRLKTSRGDYTSKSLVIATGGLSIPKIGATGFGYDIARQFGLEIIPPLPALDGFVLEQFKELSGVSLDVILTCNGVSFRENILFTHKGLSGPAALQGSLYLNPGDPIMLNLVPDIDIKAWFAAKKMAGSKAEVKNLLLEFFPQSFSEKFCEWHLPKSLPLNQMSQKQIDHLCQQLTTWTLTPKSTVGFSKAEVTRGGVSTDELSSKTMESKKIPGLYFIGEVVDVTGWLGGYNFQWAWSSGWVVGQYV
ncbi:MAG: NAD(P)/FAD-dependent oxidoreductase [Deltaproteobacteria bacterium]|nr:NAD(P)/FAD-dependent oxidoreductase [Deltaproteobacteria bacterium]